MKSLWWQTTANLSVWKPRCQTDNYIVNYNHLFANVQCTDLFGNLTDTYERTVFIPYDSKYMITTNFSDCYHYYFFVFYLDCPMPPPPPTELSTRWPNRDRVKLGQNCLKFTWCLRRMLFTEARSLIDVIGAVIRYVNGVYHMRATFVLKLKIWFTIDYTTLKI